MIGFCERSGVPLDFISTHHYPTDAAIGSSIDVEAQMAAAGRGILHTMAERAVQQAGRYPLCYTEWNSSPSDRDRLHDLPFAAAFILKTVIDNLNLVDIYSYWVFTDIFEENGMPSTPFHGGFGLLNLHGIPKPSYRAFQLLHALGTERLALKQEPGGSGTLELFAARRRDAVVVLAYNHDVPGSPIAEEAVSIELRGVRGAPSAFIERIDEGHANPRRRWVEMGSPEYPDPDAGKELLAASRLEQERVDFARVPGGLAVTLTVPPHGVASLTVAG
jgi:xylan 1,4-beta-xylosidase